jgi:hypothetical protein|tara:strand:+ start:668 stop:847 length:180 start_codon:yes stop_codon:yes gene_type:complete
MSLTNVLLFLILVTLATYAFMPWKNIDKGSKLNMLIQFISWAITFGIILIILIKLNWII